MKFKEYLTKDNLKNTIRQYKGFGFLVSIILIILLGLLFTIKKPNNFGNILKRVGTAIFIGGLFYGTVFYRIELYEPLLTLPVHIVHTFMFGVCLWVVLIVVLIIVKKILRKSVDI